MKRENVYKITDGRCFYCGCQLDIDTFHKDHLIPKSKKGNILVPCCPTCNQFKSDLSIEEFREKLQKELFDDFHVQMLMKYYRIEKKPIVFYYEKLNIAFEKDGKCLT